MSIYNGTVDPLHTQLNDLLVDNGAAVTIRSIEALVKYIGRRDQLIINDIIRNNEAVLRQLQADTAFTDMQPSDPDADTKASSTPSSPLTKEGA